MKREDIYVNCIMNIAEQKFYAEHRTHAQLSVVTFILEKRCRNDDKNAAE